MWAVFALDITTSKMFCKCFKKCFIVLIFAVSVFGKSELRLTSDQKARINKDYFKKSLNNETTFDKRSRYLYEIINSRPENLDISIGNDCIIKDLNIPDFASLKGHDFSISDLKCLEYLWKMRYYEEIEIAEVTCNDESRMPEIKNILNLHVPDNQHSEQPHMGAIGWQKSKETWLFVCEGALISERHVLTSASCTKLPRKYKNEISDLEPKVVRFGVYDISDKEQLGKSPKDVLISKITKYPTPTNMSKYYYNIAIIEMEENLIFSSMIHPACLWTNTTYLTSKGELTGWYDIVSNKKVKTKELSRKSSFDIFDKIELIDKPKPQERKPNLPVNKSIMQLKRVRPITNIHCDVITYKKRSKWWKGTLHNLQCAFSDGYEKSCQLERGTVFQSQLQIPEITDWNMHYVFGVASGDLNCIEDSRLFIYAKTSVFREWIEKNVWPEV